MTSYDTPRKFFSVFNHTLTDQQIIDIKNNLKVDIIVPLPESLKPVWGQIPPELESIDDFIAPVKHWVKTNAHESDIILLQGDFGATWLMVKFAFENRLTPVYATTSRKVSEKVQKDGSLKTEHIFVHQIFRKYGC